MRSTLTRGPWSWIEAQLSRWLVAAAACVAALAVLAGCGGAKYSAGDCVKIDQKLTDSELKDTECAGGFNPGDPVYSVDVVVDGKNGSCKPTGFGSVTFSDEPTDTTYCLSIATSSSQGAGSQSTPDQGAVPEPPSEPDTVDDQLPEPAAQVNDIAGGQTELVLDSDFVRALGDSQVVPGPVGDATISTEGVAALPATGGNLAFYTPLDTVPFFQGVINHDGSGLSFQNSDTTLEVENVTVDLQNLVVTGDVDGTSGTPLFSIDARTVTPAETSSDGSEVAVGGGTVRPRTRGSRPDQLKLRDGPLDVDGRRRAEPRRHRGSLTWPVCDQFRHLHPMTDLRGSNPADFAFLNPIYGDPGYERWDKHRSGNDGHPGADAFPRLGLDGTPVLVESERTIGKWTASSIEVLRKESGEWKRLAEARKTKATVTLTDRRLTVVLSEIDLTNRFGQRPTRRSKLAMRAISRVSSDLLDLETVAGHLALENVQAVSTRRKKTQEVLLFALIRTGSGTSPIIAVVLGLSDADAPTLAAATERATIQRWESYELPPAVADSLASVGRTSDESWDAPFFKPLGQSEKLVVLTRARSTLPPTLVRYGHTVREALPDPVRLPDGPAAPWQCPECGHEGNPAGRVRCVACRREVGHLT